MRKARHRRDIYPGVPRAVPAPRRKAAAREPLSNARAEHRLLFEGADWNFDTLQPHPRRDRRRSRSSELGLDTYPNQIEVITTEQMLDAYSSIGMPLFYRHWSFGKHFAQQRGALPQGLQGLAYEIVINSNPCISYIMEENSATMQTLVIAHAAFGHNHFFKNNYLFKQWTDADGILDYLDFAKGYIAKCEERYGQAEVERLLDAAHALLRQGVHRYPAQAPARSALRGTARGGAPHGTSEQLYNDLWRTVPGQSARLRDRVNDEIGARRCSGCRRRTSSISSRRPRRGCRPWQREILRIVRD